MRLNELYSRIAKVSPSAPSQNKNYIKIGDEIARKLTQQSGRHREEDLGGNAYFPMRGEKKGKELVLKQYTERVFRVNKVPLSTDCQKTGCKKKAKSRVFSFFTLGAKLLERGLHFPFYGFDTLPFFKDNYERNDPGQRTTNRFPLLQLIGCVRKKA